VFDSRSYRACFERVKARFVVLRCEFRCSAKLLQHPSADLRRSTRTKSLRAPRRGSFFHSGQSQGSFPPPRHHGQELQRRRSQHNRHQAGISCGDEVVSERGVGQFWGGPLEPLEGAGVDAPGVRRGVDADVDRRYAFIY
jgi:hypothetical protein